MKAEVVIYMATAAGALHPEYVRVHNTSDLCGMFTQTRKGVILWGRGEIYLIVQSAPVVW